MDKPEEFPIFHTAVLKPIFMRTLVDAQLYEETNKEFSRRFRKEAADKIAKMLLENGYLIPSISRCIDKNMIELIIAVAPYQKTNGLEYI